MPLAYAAELLMAWVLRCNGGPCHSVIFTLTAQRGCGGVYRHGVVVAHRACYSVLSRFHARFSWWSADVPGSLLSVERMRMPSSMPQVLISSCFVGFIHPRCGGITSTAQGSACRCLCIRQVCCTEKSPYLYPRRTIWWYRSPSGACFTPFFVVPEVIPARHADLWCSRRWRLLPGRSLHS
jgi:hypothetical protein